MHEGDKVEDDFGVSLYNVRFGKICGIRSEVSKLLDFCTLFFLLPVVFKTGIVLDLIAEAIIRSADIDALFQQHLVAKAFNISRIGKRVLLFLAVACVDVLDLKYTFKGQELLGGVLECPPCQHGLFVIARLLLKV